ncbi:hypothetical protein E4U23_005262 [Claviceps purpurea]|nr:hypothetical protein E4U23_005262 [Claviceps purpurea]
MFTDRRYGRADSPRNTYAGKGKSPRKQCLFCGRQGRLSTNHSRDEQKKAKDKWWKDKRLDGAPTDKRYDAFHQAYEGVTTSTEISDDEDEYEIEEVGARAATRRWLAR